MKILEEKQSQRNTAVQYKIHCGSIGAILRYMVLCLGFFIFNEILNCNWTLQWGIHCWCDAVLLNVRHNQV